MVEFSTLPLGRGQAPSFLRSVSDAKLSASIMGGKTLSELAPKLASEASPRAFGSSKPTRRPFHYRMPYSMPLYANVPSVLFPTSREPRVSLCDCSNQAVGLA